jgi:hypothetical protein
MIIAVDLRLEELVRLEELDVAVDPGEAEARVRTATSRIVLEAEDDEAVMLIETLSVLILLLGIDGVTEIMGDEAAVDKGYG